MRLYLATDTNKAREIIDAGFVGARGQPEDESGKPPKVIEWCKFRDLPPGGLTPSLTSDVEGDVDDEGDVSVTISGGAVLADDPGDFVLSIDVPDEVALAHEIREDPPAGWPFRQFWLEPDVANRYRDTLHVFDSADGEEVRPDLVGK